ncbi:hypothetical protein OG563_36990 [Nocardia vinacea]|uniref:Alpha-galactosidase n=1 Tax=Nocardia vinacea TaxID=96468 RepID=A0ABZ1YNW7_9NOCA|nr:hypothetical protein [Nocardia vinacea]
MLVVGLQLPQYAAGLLGAGTESRVPPQLVQQLGSPETSLTPDEQRAHFSLWAMLAAPLLAGNDVRTMSADTAAILTNREVIAIDQDQAAQPGRFLPVIGGSWSSSWPTARSP